MPCTTADPLLMCPAALPSALQGLMGFAAKRQARAARPGSDDSSNPAEAAAAQVSRHCDTCTTRVVHALSLSCCMPYSNSLAVLIIIIMLPIMLPVDAMA
jgi:hypothetical protein